MDVNEIMHEAIDLGACEKTSSVSNWKTLSWLFFSPQGMEFCANNNFPTLEMFREMNEEIASNCIFVDKGVLNRSNDSSVAIIGDTDARLTFDDPTKVHKVIVMHGARVFIVARNYAVVKLVNIGDENKVFVNKDNTAVILK